MTCTYTKEAGTFSGSLKSKPLDADQLAYLKGSNAVYEALWTNQPEAEHVEDDFAYYKKQAKAVAAALDTHLTALKNIQQPETVKLRARLKETADAWEKAASAGDTDAFYLAYDRAFTGIDPGKTVAARKELKLATTVPADEAEVWAALTRSDHVVRPGPCRTAGATAGSGTSACVGPSVPASWI